MGLGVKNSHLKLICFVSVSSVLFLFLWALVSENSNLKFICFVSVSSVLCLSSCGPWCQENSHLKLICFVSVSSVLCIGPCPPTVTVVKGQGPQTIPPKTIIIFKVIKGNWIVISGLGNAK